MTVKGYVYDSVISTTSMTITEGCIILIFTVVLFMLVKTVPQMVAGVASGASTGGIHLGGSGAAMAGAAAVATGGTMIAMQAAGAGLALSSAYMQTVENKANGAGLFQDGGGGDGLSGAMSTGLRTAGDFMANLASGAWDTTKDKAQDAKEAIQANSVGGQISANIDAERSENKANLAAITGKTGNNGNGGAAGSALSNAGGDSGDGDGNGVGGSSRGDTPPPLPTTGASAGAATIGAEASGGSVVQDSGFDWGGSVACAVPFCIRWFPQKVHACLIPPLVKISLLVKRGSSQKLANIFYFFCSPTLKLKGRYGFHLINH